MLSPKGQKKPPRITAFFFAFQPCARRFVSHNRFFLFAFCFFLFLCAVSGTFFLGGKMQKRPLASGAVVHFKKRHSGWLFLILYFQKKYLVNIFATNGTPFSFSFSNLTEAYAFYLFIIKKSRFKILNYKNVNNQLNYKF